MQNSFGAESFLDVEGERYRFFDLNGLASVGADLDALPLSTKILLENLLRHEDGDTVRREDILALACGDASGEREIAFRPARIVMPDSSGVPLLADLTAMRDWVAAMGGDPRSVNPLIPIDMVIDHSATVEFSGRSDARALNLGAEYAANGERYSFLRWASQAYDNFTLFPPGSGIIHQLNIEHLALPVRVDADGTAIPDTLIGLDSHTPMVNGLGVLGWGVGGIEAASAMLGEPLMMPLLPVVGCRLTGSLRPGVTSTDVVLTVTQKLRAFGVVGTVVEFTGAGLAGLPAPDRCTIANMAAEYGATMGLFPIDQLTIDYLRATGRPARDLALIEAYARRQGMWGANDKVVFPRMVEVDLSTIETAVAGPRKPEQRNRLADVARSFTVGFPDAAQPLGVAARDRQVDNGDVVIASISSCTNTSNPALLLAAGLLASKAVAAGLKVKPWVKTSLSPGSPVAGRYLAASGLQEPLDRLGFQIVGFGCMTCAGMSGPLLGTVERAIVDRGLTVAAVLSSNRNFEGRVHPSVAAGYLASPPMVVAYALAGSVLVDLTTEPIGHGRDGSAVFLRDIWPSPAEIDAAVSTYVTADLFHSIYSTLSVGDASWHSIVPTDGDNYEWDGSSTYLCRPPYFDSLGATAPNLLTDIEGARPLAIFGDGVTTDHISPGGAIVPSSAAGRYLNGLGVSNENLHSYIARRVNHDVMVRATFANSKLKNLICPDQKGGWTRHFPSGDLLPIHEAADRYRAASDPVIVIAGRDYGIGSSRDWAAKGPYLLGVRAVIAESFERIHRSNLAGMGILPLQLVGTTREALALDGIERIDVPAGSITQPNQVLTCRLRRATGEDIAIDVVCRLQTAKELDWMRHGGVLPYIAGSLLDATARTGEGREQPCELTPPA